MNLISSNSDVNVDVNQLVDKMLAGDNITVAGVAVLGTLFLVFLLFVCFGQILSVIGRWKTAKKLGATGWSQVIPVYSEWTMSNAAGCESALCIALTILDALTLVQSFLQSNGAITYVMGTITFAFIVVRCVVLYQVAQRFGKGGGFTFGLAVLPWLFWMILGCGSAQPVEE